MKRWLVPLLLLLAALGGGLFWWKGRGDGARPAAGAADAGAAAGPRAPRERESPTGESPAPAGAVRYDDDPAGTLRLEGQVIDEEERPVGGALVAISSNPPREVRSEADGSFAFDGLLARAYSVEARKDDGVAGPTTVVVSPRVEPVTLRLRAGATLAVTVLDAGSKKPVGGASVEVRGITVQKELSGPDGVARVRGLKRGAWVSLKVTRTGYAPALELFPLERGKDVHEHTVRLVAGVAVNGRVVSSEGKPVAGARVLAHAASTPWDAQDWRHDAVETDAQGRFRLPAVAPGSWRFEAAHADHAPGASEPVTIAAGAPSPPEVVITLTAGGAVAGEVRDAGGKPVPYATVRVAGARSWFEWDATRQAACDAEGRFEVKGLPRIPIKLMASAEQGASDVVPVDLTDAPRREGVVLVLSQDGTVAGVVVDEKGQPVAEAQVIALPEFGSAGDDAEMDRWTLGGAATDVTDQGGQFRLTGLPKGSYRLRAARGEGAGGSGAAFDPSIWQRAGEVAATGTTDVKLVLEADASIKGKIAFADGTTPALYSVSTAQWGQSTPFSAKDGAFRLEGVAPGRRFLTVTGPGFMRKTTDAYEVKPGQETDVGTIVVERGRTIRGRVVDATGAPVAGAKVTGGARLFGDGKSAGGAGGAFGGGLAKSADTGEDGRFELAGLGVARVLVVGEHEQKGRSPVTVVPPGDGDVELTLALAPPGSVEGKVVSGGAPVPRAIVTAQPANAARSQSIVSAGADGIFRFDVLAPDTYTVSAVRAKGMAGAELASRSVVVVSGKTAQVTLTLPKSDLTLEVSVVGGDGKPVDNAVVAIISGGPVSVKTGEDLEDLLASRGEGGYQQGMILQTAPKRSITFANIEAGPWSVCAIPMKGNLMDPQVAEQLQKDADKLAVYCAHTTVTAAPNAQTFTVKVP
jgi:uncharacterized GH25 family protein